jgi:Na+:H+ antiporter, NhaC family
VPAAPRPADRDAGSGPRARFRGMSPGGPPRMTLAEALLPIATLLALLAAGLFVLEPGAALLLIVLLGAAAVAITGAIRHGGTLRDIARSVGAKIVAVLPALLILLAIGMLIATWIASGTIPFLVYWGVRLVRPEFFLPTAFLATALMSLFTGTSWGSAGTVGVALLGTAAALGVPLPAAAGAVVSGAYFGDKMSPLSDTTNITAIAAGAALFAHVRHMLYTALPSVAVALAVYTLASAWMTPAAAAAGSAAILRDLESHFRLHWVVLLPAAVVVWGVVRRSHPAAAIALASVVAAVIAVLFQGFTVADTVAAALTGFRADMLAGGAATGELFRVLVERGGLQGMAAVMVVVLAAFLLAAGMEVSGALPFLLRRMLDAVRSVFGLIAATMGAGAALIGLTSHAGVTALVVGGLFQTAYRERGLAPVNLSRSIEDSVTITEPLMPWTVSGLFMATTLGVATTRYAPWALFCYTGPVFSLLIARLYGRTGWGVKRLEAAPGPDGGTGPAAVAAAPRRAP